MPTERFEPQANGLRIWRAGKAENHKSLKSIDFALVAPVAGCTTTQDEAGVSPHKSPAPTWTHQNGNGLRDRIKL